MIVNQVDGTMRPVLNSEHSVSKETRELINFHRGVNGIGGVADKGIVLPPKNLTNAFVGYVIDAKTGRLLLRKLRHATLNGILSQKPLTLLGITKSKTM